MAKEKEFVDLAMELRKQYQANKMKFPRGKRKNLWLGICQLLFQKHGERLGYKDIHTFKSDLKKVQIRLSKKDEVGQEIFDQGQDRDDFGYGEGSTTFTQWQIRILGLNPESY